MDELKSHSCRLNYQIMLMIDYKNQQHFNSFLTND